MGTFCALQQVRLFYGLKLWDVACQAKRNSRPCFTQLKIMKMCSMRSQKQLSPSFLGMECSCLISDGHFCALRFAHCQLSSENSRRSKDIKGAWQNKYCVSLKWGLNNPAKAIRTKHLTKTYPLVLTDCNIIHNLVRNTWFNVKTSKFLGVTCPTCV